MTAPKRRVAVTGFGSTSPLGLDNDAFWNAIDSGASGVAPLAAFAPPADFPPFAAEVKGFDVRKYLAKENRKAARIWARDIGLAVGAAKTALDHAGILGKVDPARLGVNCGAGLIATEHEELSEAVHASLDAGGKFDLKLWGEHGLEKLFPLWMLKYLPNMPACHISILYDAQGPNNSVTCGEASALLAIGEAVRVMERGMADAFVAGGADTKIHPLSLVRMSLLGRLSARRDDPQTASRPFDANRDGMVAGEGAGFLILEERGLAEKRGAQIFGEILGFGSSWNQADRGDAALRALASAVRDAGLKPRDLGIVFAHGQGAADEDRVEHRALATFLADAPRTRVVALKGYWGYQGAASGAFELIAGLLAAKHRKAPGSLNFAKPDADAPPLALSAEPFDFPDAPFAALAYGVGGQCGALIVRPTVG